MFQNIIDDIEQEEYDNYESEVKKEKINIKQFLHVQDIVLYAIAFMVSMVGFNEKFAPFGLAIFAATCASKRPTAILYAMVLIGTTIGFGFSGLLVFVLTSLLFLGMILVFKPKLEEESRNEKCKLGIYVLTATFIVQARENDIFNVFIL